MYKININKRLYSLLIVFAMLLSLFTPIAQDLVIAESANAITASEYGSQAYQHINHLSKELGGARTAGSEFEEIAANYIKDEFESYNYETKIEDFSFVSTRGSNKGETVNSQNIVAIKRGQSEKQVIIGAHYDQVTTGGSEGASDNASGLGAMLEVAQRLKNVETDHTILFLAFGSEEVGLKGSTAYVETMTDQEIANTVAMINLDTIIGGDYAYVYGGTNDKGWVRDKALNISDELGLDLITQEGLNPDHKWGQTGDWSDHAPFNKKGIAVAYFESTNWLVKDENGDYTDGYIETTEGSIMHTGNDTLDFIEANFPGRIMDRLNTNIRVLEKLLVEILSDVSEVDKLISRFKSAETDISEDYISKVRAARKAYDALTDDQKELVMASNVKKLNEAEAKIENTGDKAIAAKVDKLISRFKSAETDISEDYISKVRAAREAYDALTDDQKGLVIASNVKKLNAAETKIKDAKDKEVAVKVDKLISRFRAEETDISEDYISKVKAAREAYDALTDDQKGLVIASNVKKLNAAETKIKDAKDKEAAAEVDKLISRFRAEETDISEDYISKVRAAREAYNALTDDQKELVSANNIKKLNEAETKIKYAEDKVAASKVDRLILRFRSSERNISPKYIAKVQAAREAYDALTDDQKQLVKSYNVKKLNTAEAKIKYAENKWAALKVDRLILRFGYKEPVSEKYIKKVKAAREAYDALTDDQKQLVKSYNVRKLNAAENRI